MIKRHRDFNTWMAQVETMPSQGTFLAGVTLDMSGLKKPRNEVSFRALKLPRLAVVAACLRSKNTFRDLRDSFTLNFKYKINEQILALPNATDSEQT